MIMVNIDKIIIPIIPIIVATVLSPFMRLILRDWKKVIKVICSLSAASYVITMIILALPQGILWTILAKKQPLYVHFTGISRLVSGFYVDILSIIFIYLALLIALLSCIFSYSLITPEDLPDLYFPLLNILTLSLYLLFIVGDLVTLFVAWELMSVATYALIFIRRSNKLAMEAGVKYIIMSGIASIMMLYAFSLIYGYLGTFNFIEISKRITTLNYLSNYRGLFIALILMTLSFGFKAALVPFHTWAPDVYQETLDPITAMLSGAASKAGVFYIIRTYFLLLKIPNTNTVLYILAALTMTVANLSAILQKDLKRLYAYSSIAHIGYIIAGLSAGNLLGFVGAIFHAVNHGIMKSLAFYSAGAIQKVFKTRDLETLRGKVRGNFAILINSIIALLALIGVPPLNGFVSKFIIVMGLINAGLIWLVVVILINFGIGAAYYLRVIQFMCTAKGSNKSNISNNTKIELSMFIPMVVQSILCFILGLAPNFMIELIKCASQMILGL